MGDPALGVDTTRGGSSRNTMRNANPQPGSVSSPMTTATKVRLRFAKKDDLRLVSHHDLMRCLERMIRRAELPVAQSQGFSPRPKLIFTLALALGIEGRREVIDIEFTEALEPSEVLRRLNNVAPDGLVWLEAEEIPPGRAAQADSVSYQLDVPMERREAARAALSALLASEHWPIVRRKADRETTIDLRAFVLDAELDPTGVLSFRLKIQPSGSARPEELLEALRLHDLLTQGSILIRTDMELVS